MREVLLTLIRLYKRFISPHKGFSCAYRIHTGRHSCSSLAYRAVRSRGVVAGLAILKQRTHLCSVVHHRCAPQRRPKAAQRGDCDLGCDLPCDLNCDSPKLLSQCCDGSSCCECGSCDWPERRRKDKRQREKYVYIPPNGLRLQAHQRPSPSPPET
jgi:uncharacterized protein